MITFINIEPSYQIPLVLLFRIRIRWRLFRAVIKVGCKKMLPLKGEFSCRVYNFQQKKNPPEMIGNVGCIVLCCKSQSVFNTFSISHFVWNVQDRDKNKAVWFICYSLWIGNESNIQFFQAGFMRIGEGGEGEGEGGREGGKGAGAVI